MYKYTSQKPSAMSGIWRYKDNWGAGIPIVLTTDPREKLIALQRNLWRHIANQVADEDASITPDSIVDHLLLITGGKYITALRVASTIARYDELLYVEISDGIIQRSSTSKTVANPHQHSNSPEDCTI